MRYLSPDGLRPNPLLIEKTRKQFDWNKFRNKKTRKAPEPHELPMPSLKLRQKKKDSNSNIKIIKGKNRTWTVITQKKGGKYKKIKRKRTIKKCKKY